MNLFLPAQRSIFSFAAPLHPVSGIEQGTFQMATLIMTRFGATQDLSMAPASCTAA
ncbi:hypothetical protein [Paracoccus tibetensis]|uniref:hypothetical protein n=1 Tax=Paracoccus tibetensis TaxID=336292 RepID=UPI001587033B|nr:hypothetical protein [Paracoccus tibetensis]